MCIATGPLEKIVIDYATPSPRWYLLVLNFKNLSWQSILLPAEYLQNADR